MKYYIHHVPGRLRIKSPAIKERPDKADAVKGILEGIDGIEGVSTNSITGSVVVYYDTRSFKPDTILDILKMQGLHDGSRPINNDDFIQQAVIKVGRMVGKVLLGWIVGRALEDTGLGFLGALI